MKRKWAQINILIGAFASSHFVNIQYANCALGIYQHYKTWYAVFCSRFLSESHSPTRPFLKEGKPQDWLIAEKSLQMWEPHSSKPEYSLHYYYAH